MKIRHFLILFIVLGISGGIGIPFKEVAQAGPTEDLLEKILQHLETSVQPTADHIVTLQASSQLSETCGFNNPTRYKFDRRMEQNGVILSPGFQIPNNQLFVITAWDWRVTRARNQGAAFLPNSVRTARLFRSGKNTGGVNGASAQSSSLSDSQGRAGAYETFPTGLVVNDRADICVEMAIPGDELLFATIQGFLFPEPSP